MAEHATALNMRGARETEAGRDPQKRRQILQGASRVFLSHGFNGASMGEIARTAEVSKGTLYVYFENKEQLFEACVEEKRRDFFSAILHQDASLTLEEELTRYGISLAEFVTSPEVIMAMQTVIGIAEQMPEIGRRFYTQGKGHGTKLFADFLDRKVAAGALDIPDTTLAAQQFADLCQNSLVQPLLFGCAMPAAERKSRIPGVVASAVRVFLAAYAPRQAPAEA